jgi:hypothetical protein
MRDGRERRGWFGPERKGRRCPVELRHSGQIKILLGPRDVYRLKAVRRPLTGNIPCFRIRWKGDLVYVLKMGRSAEGFSFGLIGLLGAERVAKEGFESHSVGLGGFILAVKATGKV